MSWSHYLFSFQGRINRAKIWLFILITIIVGIVYGILFGTLVGISGITAASYSGSGGLAAAGASVLLTLVLGCVIYIALFVASLAVATKRLHDRNKSAIWLLVFIVAPLVINIYVFATMIAGHGLDPQQMAAAAANPMLLVLRLVAGVLSLWGFVELYCLRGTVGDNRYGPDPLSNQAEAFSP
jgi:uncharacterized membrane protein YhaH (DUF805 family)